MNKPLTRSDTCEALTSLIPSKPTTKMQLRKLVATVNCHAISFHLKEGGGHRSRDIRTDSPIFCPRLRMVRHSELDIPSSDLPPVRESGRIQSSCLTLYTP